ncbi:alpha/beta-hydrolase [Daldinia caldariorum]|uniref:alpha/beta-hydrolase n=1 Tax=Daldinia caldariorum TaxID=326644 RepID=UPI002008BDF7|nr:alpha/beta-hydrolase [Daldinia caldariorum]KAI1471658.1 alpha/beta-hydrolase [Daldinia caldariorum]
MKPFPDAKSTTPLRRLKIPPILRSRYSWRWIIVLIFLSCYLFSLPPFPRPLPKYSGPYPVGAVDVEIPLTSPRIIDTAQFKKTKANAFELNTVLFTLYYPSVQHATSRRPKHNWVPKPISVTGEGYAKFARVNNFIMKKVFTGALKALVGHIPIPANVDVPLAGLASTVMSIPEIQNVNTEIEKVIQIEKGGHPVIVFSHGMASSRTDYTHYAGELASRGYIVALLEHRDGSCPGSVVMQHGKPDQVKLTFDVPEVETIKGKDLTVDEFKRAQLDFREAEIEETVRVLKLINEGQGKEVFKSNMRDEGVDFLNWEGRLNTDEMIVAGHSYGATGAMQALRGGPSGRRPFKGGVILDPGKQSGQLNDDIRVPVLVIHSNSWSSKYSLFYGRAHFDMVRDIVENNVLRGMPSWFATSLGTSHPSVTDAPLLEPLLLSWTTGARIDVYEGLRQYMHVTENFLWFLSTGEKRGLLREKAEFPQYDEGKGFGMWKPAQGENEKTGGSWYNWRRYWQVHVSPN